MLEKKISKRNVIGFLSFVTLLMLFCLMVGIFAINSPKINTIKKESQIEAHAYVPPSAPDSYNFGGGYNDNKAGWPTTINSAGTIYFNSGVSSRWGINMSKGSSGDDESNDTELKMNQGTSTDKRYGLFWLTIPISSAMTNAIAAGKVSMTFSCYFHHGTTGGTRSTTVSIDWGTKGSPLNGINNFTSKRGEGSNRGGAFDSWQAASASISDATSDVTAIRISISNSKSGLGRHLDLFVKEMRIDITNNISIKADDKSKTYGDSDPALTYSVTSGYVFGSLSGSPARASGENVGSYSINVNALSATGHNITRENGTFTINKRNVTVTATNKSKTYGDADVPLTFTNTSLGSGVAISGTPTRDPGNNVGSYAIKEGTVNNENNSNYNITFVDGTYTINRRSVTVVPTAGQSKVYGSSDPTLAYSVTNIVSGETLTGALSRSAGNNAGTYNITQGTVTTANNANYTVGFTSNVVFTINKKPITITPEAGQTKIYGNAEGTYTYTVSPGLAYQDSLSGSLSRNNLDNENAGSYVINQGTIQNSNNTNYLITFSTTAVNMNILKRPVTVTAQSKTITYGDADVPLTYTSTSLGNGIALSGSLARTPSSDVGNHPITQGTVTNANNTNYEITFVGATYTINAKAVKINIADKSSNYKAPLAQLTYNLDPTTPLCYGQGVAVLDIVLTKAIGTNAGVYDITGSQGPGKSGNYSVTFLGSNGAKGKYTINKINRTILTSGIVTSYTYNGVTQTVNSGADFNANDKESNASENTIVYSNNTFKDVPSSGKQIVSLSCATSTNYHACSATVEISIAKRYALAIIENKQSIYNRDIVALTYQVSGSTPLGGTDTKANLGVSLSTTAVKGNDAGEYPISGVYSSINYTVTFSGDWGENGIYTISKETTTFDTSGISSHTYDGSQQTVTGITANHSEASIVFSNHRFTNVPNDGGESGALIVRFSTPETTNYLAAEGTRKIIINKAQATIDHSGVVKNYAYSGYTQTVNSGATTNQVGSHISNVVYSNNTFRNVPEGGTQTVTLALGENNNYKGATKSFAITVSKANLNVTIIDKQSVYGSNLETLSFEISSDTPLKGPDTPSDLGINLSKADGLYVGQYAIICSGYTQTNYNITFTNGKYIITPKSITVKIDNKQSSYGQPIVTFTYGLAEGSTLAYSDTISMLDIIVTKDAGNNAGTYNLIGSQGALASSNYTVTIQNGTYKINKISRDIDVSGVVKSYTYNGSEQVVNSGAVLSALESNSNENTLVYTNNRFTDVPESGKKTITITILESTNYLYKSVNVEISIAKYLIVLDLQDKQSEYKDALVSLGFTINMSYALQGADTELDLGVSLVTEATVNSDVGTYPILGSYNSTNYIVEFTGSYFGGDKATYTITKASLSIDIEDKTSVYGKNILPLTFVLSEGNSLKSGDTLSDLGITLVKADGLGVDNYVISSSGYTNGNYEVTFSNGTYSITPKAITVKVQEKTSTYGQPLVPLTFVIDSLTTLEYSDTTSVLDIILTKNEGLNAGQYRIQGSQGANATSNYTVTFENNWYYINRATRTIITDTMPSEYTYNGELQTITGATLSALESNENENVLTYANNTFTNVPESGKQTVLISIGQTTNYKSASAEIEISILKAIALVTQNVVESYTYNGTTQTIDSTNSGLVLNHSESTLIYSNNTFKDVPASGTVVVNINADESTNYLACSEEITFDVNRYAITINIDSKESVYSENLVALTWQLLDELLGSDTIADLDISLSTSAAEGSNAGEYGINFSYTNPNYSISSNNAYYVVTKANAVITDGGTTWQYTYNGSTQTINSGATLNHSETSLVYTNNTFRDVPANGKIVVSITSNETTNYKSANISVVVNIKKYDITIHISDLSSVYAETIKDLEYTLSSPVVGSDTDAVLNIVLSKESGINVGSYEISATASSNNYEITIEGSNGSKGTYTITKATPIINVDSVVKEYTYTGDLVMVNSGATTNQTGDYISVVEYSNNTFTNVDEGNGRVVTVSVAENNNYNAAIKEIVLTVNKAVTIINTSSAVTEYVYNGQEQTANLNITHSQIGRYISTPVYENNKFRDVPESGAQTVTVTVPENINYLGATASILINIEKAEALIDVSNMVTEYVYNGSMQTITGAVLNHAESILAYSNNTFTNVPASLSQTVSIEAVASTNYKEVRTQITVVINKATQTIDTSQVKIQYEREELPITINTGATISDPEQTLVYADNYYPTEESAEDAILHIYAIETTNYSYTEAFVIIVVAKQMPEINLDGIVLNYVYTGSLQVINSGAVLLGDNNEQIIKYRNNSFTTVAEGNGMMLEVYVERTENFAAYVWYLEVAVEKATSTITINPEKTVFTYNGALQEVICGTLNHSETTIEYTNNTFTTVNEGNSLNVVLRSRETANYKEAVVSTPITVDKAVSVIDKTGVSTSYTYTGEMQTVTGACLNHNETQLVYVSNTFVTVAEGNALTVQINAPATDNYKEASTTLTITVEKATYDMSSIGLESKAVDYDNTEQSISIIGTLPNGVSVSYDGNQKVQAGHYEITATFTGDYDNYNTIENKSAILTINKISYDFSQTTYQDMTVTYNATPQSIQTENVPVGLDGIEVVQTYIGNRTNIGNAVLRVNFSSNSPNYYVKDTDAERTANITIVAAVLNVVGKDRYSSSYQNVDAVNLSQNNYKLVGVQGNDQPKITYTAKFEDTSAVGAAVVLMSITEIDNANYVLPSSEYTIRLDAAIIYPILINVNSEEFLFDGTPKMPQISATIAGEEVTKIVRISNKVGNVVSHAINADEYTVEVTVNDEYAGNKTYSELMRINKLQPVITIHGDRTQTYGSFVPLTASISVDYNDGSNLNANIKYSFSGLNPVAGTHNVMASFTGSTNYKSAYISDEITINRKLTSVTISSDNQFIYNGKEREVAFGVSGVVAGDKKIVSLDYDGATSIINPGSYNINVLLSNSNYEIENIVGPRKAIVSKAPLYVSIENQKLIEGVATRLSIVYKGFMENEDVSSLEAEPQAPIAEFKAGEHLVVAFGGSSSKYELIFMPTKVKVYIQDIKVVESTAEFTAKGTYEAGSKIEVKPVDGNRFFTGAFISNNGITSAYRVEINNSPIDGGTVEVVYNNVNIRKSLFAGAYYIDNAGNKRRISRSAIKDGSITMNVESEGGYIVVYQNRTWIYVLTSGAIAALLFVAIKSSMIKKRAKRSARKRARWLS